MACSLRFPRAELFAAPLVFGLLVEAACGSLIQIENYYFRHGSWLESATSLLNTAFAIGCFANAVPRAIGYTKNAYCSREARWGQLGPNSARTSKVSDNLNGVQRDGNNLKIVVVHPLYVDLGSVDRGNYFPELRRP